MTWDGIFYFAERSVRHENTAFAGAAMAPGDRTVTADNTINRKGDITMKANLKKFAALIFAAVFVFCLAACGGEQQKVSVIGISQYGEHESQLILYEAAAKALKDAGVTKLPNLAALKAEYRKLDEEKGRLYERYSEEKAELTEYGIFKQNVDSILRVTPGKEQTQELRTYRE